MTTFLQTVLEVKATASNLFDFRLNQFQAVLNYTEIILKGSVLLLSHMMIEFSCRFELWNNFGHSDDKFSSNIICSNTVTSQHVDLLVDYFLTFLYFQLLIHFL